MKISGTLFFLKILLITTIFSCQTNKADKVMNESNITSYNPVVYFEIPVNDIDRAIDFYTAVFDFHFEKQVIDHNEMALFPFTDGQTGVSGSLAKGEIYKPTKGGVVIYFKTLDIDSTLQRVVENGGQLLYPKTPIGNLGLVAEFEDCEGNRIALHQSAE
ncbi:VOC family protein [Rapidithrix thailandica]|uniref:VOC family protein n=1 Tax=Rapidithrix thailandica TaxID=413964 RepID=A0AAW9SAK0_9BACT